MVDFVFDEMAAGNRGYPNLSRHRPRPYTPEWRQFDRHWPNTVPPRLLLFLDHARVPYQSWSTDQAPVGSWYPICFSWFDFTLDYLDLVPAATLDLVRQGRFRILFYYHEGDNPSRIHEALTSMLWRHGIDVNRMLFISGNSAARSLSQSLYFDDFESWFWVLNREQAASLPDRCPAKDFTALSRIHKSWRACVMHDLAASDCLGNSVWSYHTGAMLDQLSDNPIQCADRWPSVQRFLEQGPYVCDDFDSDRQNDHHWVNQDLYHGARFHIVLETHFDADQSGGAFLTEKTYKCIKFGQPFLIVGPPGCLAVLRSHGYRVFDHVIDNSYDTEQDNTRRWDLLLAEIQKLRRASASAWQQCQSDVQHNQDLFFTRLEPAVNNLIQEIQCHW